MSLPRIPWIDTARGCGIFLIFLGHTTLTTRPVDHYLFSFHLPLFFFISGFFYKTADTRWSFRGFLAKEARTRMVPYFSFGLLMYFIWLAPILLRKYGVYHGSHEIPDSLFVKPLLGMFYGIGDGNWLPHNSIMWFLACLIVTEILFFLVHSTAKTKRTIAITLLVFAVLGYLDSIYIGTRLPFSMDVALTGVVFYGSGYLLRDPLFKADLRISMVLLCLLIGLAIAFSNDRIDMNYRVFGNPVLFYASAFSSIFACIGFAKAVPRIKLISYIGQNSLVFFLLQNLGFLMVNALAYAILRARPNSVSPNMGYAVSYVMLVLLVLVPVVNLITSRVPGITGRAPRKRHQVQIAEVAVAEPNGRSRVEQLH